MKRGKYIDNKRIVLYKFSLPFYSSMVRTIHDGRQKSLFDAFDALPEQAVIASQVEAQQEPVQEREVTNSPTVSSIQGTVGEQILEMADEPSPHEHCAVSVEKADLASSNEPKIDDVGEKIGGARKDDWKDHGLNVHHLDNMTDAEKITHITRDNIWPLHITPGAEVKNPLVLAFCKQVRGLIPPRPLKSDAESLQHYVDGIAQIRDGFAHATDMPEIFAAWEKQVAYWEAFTTGENSAQGRAIERAIAKQAGRYTIRSPLPHKQRLSGLIKKAVKDVLSGFPQSREAHAATFAKTPVEIDPSHSADGGLDHVTQTGIYLDDLTSGTPSLRLRALFMEEGHFALDTPGIMAAREHVRTWFAAQFPGLVREPEAKEAETKSADPWKRTYLDEVVRTGLDHREGRNVEAQDFMESFGFRAVEFGNWVNQEERQEVINHAYDALMDLAIILGLEKRSISLKGRLALGFGSRGRGGAAAHYEPGRMVINLTKTSGSGSLAHEWFHGVGHFLAPDNATDILGREPAPDPAKSTTDLARYARQKADQAPVSPSLRDQLGKALQALFLIPKDKERAMADLQADIAGAQSDIERVQGYNARWQAMGGKKATRSINNNNRWIAQRVRQMEAAQTFLTSLESGDSQPSGFAVTQFYLNAVHKTASGRKSYWARPVELFARAGEAAVHAMLAEQGQRSDYLVTLPHPDAYPQGRELAHIQSTLQELFAAMCAEPSSRHGLEKQEPEPKAEPQEITTNAYEARLQRRKERLTAAAERARVNAEGFFEKADLREEKSGIPFGQPILVGHHSEGRHRRAIERAHNNMRKGIEESDRAERLAERAENVGLGGISSDDPEAITKLQAKLADCEKAQVFMVAANKLVRKAIKAGLTGIDGSQAWNAYFQGLNHLGEVSEDEALKLIQGDVMGQKGYATYRTSNNSAEIRRLKKRIVQLEKAAQAETTERDNGHFQVVENVEENRIQMIFDGKPSDAIRQILKDHAFKWSKRNMAWQRQLTNNARYVAKLAEKAILEAING